MKIAIIGAGAVGTTLGTGWKKGGHTISYGVRQANDQKFASLRASGEVVTAGEATAGAEVVVLCTPWPGTREAIRSCGDLTGKIVIDVINPIREDFTGLDLGFDTSGGEKVAEWASGAHVFKAMNQIGAGLMDHPSLQGGTKPAMFVAGSGQGQEAVLGLVAELGFEAIHVGGLEMARTLEPLAWLWITLAVKQGFGPTFAFGVLRKAV